MLDLLKILFISAVQGVAEFLPISSSGHLAVINHLFERLGSPLAEGGADFIKLGILLHFGTLIAVCIVFRKRILDLLGKDVRLIPLLFAATVPCVIVGLSIKKNADWISENLFVTAVGFIVTGSMLLFSLRSMKGEKLCAEMSWRDALVIGCVQAVAVLPGISRSGSTIVAGLCCKLRRDEAATFSFLLSIPVIAGGGIMEIKDLFKTTPTESSLSTSLLLIGMAISCVVGIFSLVWLLEWLKKGKLWYFAVWVFLMCPITFALAVTQPGTESKPIQPAPAAVPSEIAMKIGSESKNEKPAEKMDEKVAVKKDDERKTEKPKTDKERPTALSKAIEAYDEPERTKLDQEEARRQYEQILAEEEARERARIEEERKREPLVDDLRSLQQLDKTDRIWITGDRKSVVVLGRVAFRDGLLELFACRIGTKEHESVVSIRVKPFLIHLGLLLCGAEPGKPVRQTPDFVPPSGDEIEIKVRWKDEKGKMQEALAQDWVLDLARSKQDDEGKWIEKQAMSTHWVFTGSMMYKDDAGLNHYVADESGELFGLSNFVGSILDVPIKSSAENADLLFACYTDRIPELDTPLTLILTPTKHKKAEPDKTESEKKEESKPEPVKESEKTVPE